jgi:hypothetical protein
MLISVNARNVKNQTNALNSMIRSGDRNTKESETGVNAGSFDICIVQYVVKAAATLAATIAHVSEIINLFLIADRSLSDLFTPSRSRCDS